MDMRKQLFVLIMLIAMLDAAAFGFSSAADSVASTRDSPFTVSDVFGKVLLEEDVYVKGMVSEILPDHTSKKGYVYQQFIITDGEESIKAFCSTKYGRAGIAEGDSVIFDGKFRKYHAEYEIYGFCSEIEIV